MSSKQDEDKGIVYSNRVLLGNWYEASKLKEERKDIVSLSVERTIEVTCAELERFIVVSVYRPLSSLYDSFEPLFENVLLKLSASYKNIIVCGDFNYKFNKFLEQMKKGDLMLARYRKMSENLNKPIVLTQSSSSIGFGAKIALLASHVPETDPPQEDKKGLLLGGRICSHEINNSQDLEDGCSVMGLSDLEPAEKNTFILKSADYCNREGELLKYNQEFLLVLSSSVARGNPLYLRYDPNPVPGLCGMFPLYLSKHPVSNCRWRALPTQGSNITRFEQEGKPLKVNTDIILNHCATNVNLGINVGCWTMGFYGKVCAPLMKTCLDVYGKELLNNVWQIYIPIAS